MTAKPSPLRGLLPALAGLLAAVLGGCAAHIGSNVVERLDPATGLTIVKARQALVFARGEFGYSRSARDYLYLGPVETDRQGVREYYLWVGVGSTLDRGYLAPRQAVPRTLYLHVRGEWMRLALRPWAAHVTGFDANHVYRTPVKARAELAARVTLNQLELMDSSGLQAIRVTDASGTASEYVRWNNAPAWPGFVEHAGGAPAGKRTITNSPVARRASTRP